MIAPERQRGERKALARIRSCRGGHVQRKPLRTFRCRLDRRRSRSHRGRHGEWRSALDAVAARYALWPSPSLPPTSSRNCAYIEPPALHNVPYNGLAKTPPMGWNSWNLFAEKIDDQTVRTMADAMVSSGMRDAGYVYVNIDDTWEGVRDAQGNLQPNHKFPDMKALADYVHSKGLKIGIYSSPGPRTCGGYPASYGHEAAGCQDLCRLGHRLSEVRLVQRGQHLQERRLAARLPEDGRRAAGLGPAHRLQPLRVRHGQRGEMGRRRWAATCGAPPATSATHGRA